MIPTDLFLQKEVTLMSNLGSRQWWALGAITLAVLAVTLDITVLSVALPTLAAKLNASESDLQWFSSGYALVLAAAMLPAGLLGDRYGRKRVLLSALVLFGAGSLACAYAPSAGFFLFARLVLGLAGANIIVMALATVTVLFNEKERPLAVGIWGAANFLAMPLGPILGGWLLTNYWWGWVFLMNVPVVLIGLVAAILLIPESRASVRPKLDPVGVVTSAGGLAALVYGLIKAGDNGWGDTAAWVWMSVGVAVLVGFFFWESWLGRRPSGQPLVDPKLFRSPAFTWGVILAAVGVMGMIGVLFTMPQYFQGVQGTDAMGSGVRLLPLVGGIVVGAGLASRLLRLLGAKITAALGFAVLAAGMLWGAQTQVGSSTGFIAAWMAVAGAGMGIALATAASAALVRLPQEQSGVASGVLQAIQKVGSPLGAAILGSVLSSAYQDQLHLAGLPAAVASVVKESVFGGVAVARYLHSSSLLASVYAAFVHGTDVALVVSAAIAGAGIILALIFLPGKAAWQAEAPRTPEELEPVGENLTASIR
jgi:MFS transporter, DHA2 family, multidrug resistance protein